MSNGDLCAYRGYLRKWYIDIGAHVKRGQLLAVIETPELDQQLDQARANLKLELWIGDLARLKVARVRKQKITENDTVIVDDFNSYPRYLACSLEPV
jgi:multidrug efflux pump subunit AcrA (membrane-fusion protein)